MQGRTGAPDVPGPPSDEVLSAQPLPTRARAHTRARPVLLLTLLAAIATWFAYDSAQQTPAARTPANGIAMDAAGGWWNVAGDRYLGLDWEGRRATLWDYSASDSGVESTGTWRATDQTVVVEVSGDAGSLTQEYEVVGSDAELFLAPAPPRSASPPATLALTPQPRWIRSLRSGPPHPPLCGVITRERRSVPALEHVAGKDPAAADRRRNRHVLRTRLAGTQRAPPQLPQRSRNRNARKQDVKSHRGRTRPRQQQRVRSRAIAVR
jgi:hypothetical protein